MNQKLAFIVCFILSTVLAIHTIRDLNGVIVENDNDICDGMCHSNYSDIIKECQYGCNHRSGIRERLNPFQSCLGACEARFRVNYAERGNDTEFINRAWEACLHACRLPYKTKIRWNVYIDLRSGEPIWNFERIISDGHRISSEALEYDDLISTVALRKSHFFMDPSSKLRFPNLNVYETDSRAMQLIMMEMLKKVRQEITSMAPRRFDGVSSIDYIGPRLVENGPNGPVIKDITELEYRPKDVLFYKGMVFKIEDLFDNYEEYQDHRTMFMYFSLIVLGFVMICGCFKLRNHYAATEAARLRRVTHQDGSDDWTKRIPTTGEAPPYYSPPERKKLFDLLKE
ncbi:uncharacterized protein CELE_F54C9.7 [Caenorhabditis elegans]|uniref:Uncharacterized protein n=1 Tax=Caenorhabditis elegans TaxID=6239 RepID=Q20756_CAEEL|nr:Uncharacterized protein CELE_F54C9.7 [Caenorhabditis elegans]CAA90253.1 Uncharacterized protein CELE_F54C9.7 [Caenorhabditis elegans]|eukprot:NP_495813.1 Uncharacterized protein CELE_F54C9.7 [Caenorhabditis elegans]